jgi:predicted lactoylglutathione lyase
MDLGIFSLSLAVKDIQKSLAFYEALGFEVTAGNANENWLILSMGSTNIGLFQGMFEQNILTFNPTNVRGVQRALKHAGIEFTLEVDEFVEGPGNATLTDPDGNAILLDQHDR